MSATAIYLAVVVHRRRSAGCRWDAVLWTVGVFPVDSLKLYEQRCCTSDLTWVTAAAESRQDWSSRVVNSQHKLPQFIIVAPSMDAFCRAMLWKSGLCCHVVSVCVCVSVCPSRSRILSKRINISSIFLPSGSQAILVFPHQTAWQYSDGNRLNRGRRMKVG